jgi:hypothetical protein
MGEYEKREFGYLRETGYIHDYLIELNALRFHTFSSQPWSTPDKPRGVRPYQLEYVAGLMTPGLLDRLEAQLKAEHPTIVLTEPGQEDILASKNADGSPGVYSWGGRMANELYLERFSMEAIQGLAVVEFVHTDWERHDDYLFKTLTSILKTLANE